MGYFNYRDATMFRKEIGGEVVAEYEYDKYYRVIEYIDIYKNKFTFHYDDNGLINKNLPEIAVSIYLEAMGNNDNLKNVKRDKQDRILYYEFSHESRNTARSGNGIHEFKLKEVYNIEYDDINDYRLVYHHSHKELLHTDTWHNNISPACSENQICFYLYDNDDNLIYRYNHQDESHEFPEEGKEKIFFEYIYNTFKNFRLFYDSHALLKKVKDESGSFECFIFVLNNEHRFEVLDTGKNIKEWYYYEWRNNKLQKKLKRI